MKRTTRRHLLGTLSALGSTLALHPLSALASDWPSRPLKLVVGFPAGSSPDLTARALAEPLAKALGQPVVVENKVGAGGNIAADAVAKASDGHTLGLMINGNMTIAKLLNPKLPYDPLKDLMPISLIGSAPLLLAAPADAPGANATQWLAQARAAGDKLSYGSPGVGTVGHLGMELFKARTGLQAVHVPYPGNPQIITALLGGQLQLALLPPGLALPQIKAGKLRAIGLTSSGRSDLAPDVPSLSEAGVRDYRLEIWNAVAAPANTLAEVQMRLARAVSEIVRSADMRQKLTQQGWDVAGSLPDELRQRINADTQALGEIIRTQKIELN